MLKLCDQDIFDKFRNDHLKNSINLFKEKLLLKPIMAIILAIAITINSATHKSLFLFPIKLFLVSCICTKTTSKSLAKMIIYFKK